MHLLVLVCLPGLILTIFQQAVAEKLKELLVAAYQARIQRLTER
jgi:hypothetical protein